MGSPRKLRQGGKRKTVASSYSKQFGALAQEETEEGIRSSKNQFRRESKKKEKSDETKLYAQQARIFLISKEELFKDFMERGPGRERNSN